MESKETAEQKAEELELEAMEQVSGGAGPLPTKIVWCGNCNDKTKWIYVDGSDCCSKCGKSSTGPRYVTRPV